MKAQCKWVVMLVTWGIYLEQCDQHYYSNETVESSCIDIFGKIIYIYTI